MSAAATHPSGLLPPDPARTAFIELARNYVSEKLRLQGRLDDTGLAACLPPESLAPDFFDTNKSASEASMLLGEGGVSTFIGEPSSTRLVLQQAIGTLRTLEAERVALDLPSQPTTSDPHRFYIPLSLDCMMATNYATLYRFLAIKVRRVLLTYAPLSAAGPAGQPTEGGLLYIPPPLDGEEAPEEDEDLPEGAVPLTIYLSAEEPENDPRLLARRQEAAKVLEALRNMITATVALEVPTQPRPSSPHLVIIVENCHLPAKRGSMLGQKFLYSLAELAGISPRLISVVFTTPQLTVFQEFEKRLLSRIPKTSRVFLPPGPSLELARRSYVEEEAMDTAIEPEEAALVETIKFLKHTVTPAVLLPLDWAAFLRQCSVLELSGIIEPFVAQIPADKWNLDALGFNNSIKQCLLELNQGQGGEVYAKVLSFLVARCGLSPQHFHTLLAPVNNMADEDSPVLRLVDFEWALSCQFPCEPDYVTLATLTDLEDLLVDMMAELEEYNVTRYTFSTLAVKYQKKHVKGERFSHASHKYPQSFIFKALERLLSVGVIGFCSDTRSDRSYPKQHRRIRLSIPISDIARAKELKKAANKSSHPKQVDSNE